MLLASCILSDNCHILSEAFVPIKLRIIKRILVVTSVGIKMVNCTDLKFPVFHIYFSNITKTYLYNFDPLKPHFYIHVVKLGFKGVYIIFLILLENIDCG